MAPPYPLDRMPVNVPSDAPGAVVPFNTGVVDCVVSGVITPVAVAGGTVEGTTAVGVMGSTVGAEAGWV